MNRMTIENRAKILSLLVEGNSLRSTSCIADCSINTVTKLLVDVGSACAEYQYKALCNLPCKQIQCGEIWSFCYSKQANVPEEFKGVAGYGDIWTWTAICPDTKLIASWLVGERSAEVAMAFVDDLSSRLANRIQLSTDGNRMYVKAHENVFGGEIDFAMLIKHYDYEAKQLVDRRYSPVPHTGSTKAKINGDPDLSKLPTSYVERQNLTMHIRNRRFTLLTNAISKKAENHAHAVALHFMYYNFGRIHKALRVTPAMEAGISTKVWTLVDIAALVIEPEAKSRGPYKKNNKNISN